GSVNPRGAAEGRTRDSQSFEYPSANGRIPVEPSRLDPSPLGLGRTRYGVGTTKRRRRSCDEISIRPGSRDKPRPDRKNLDTAICWRASQVLGRYAGLA